MMTTTPQSPPAPQEQRAEPQVEPSKPHIPLYLRIYTVLIAVPLMAVSTAFFGSISLVCGLWDRSGRQQHFIARVWARTLLWFSLSPVEVIGAEKFAHLPVSVYASNHLSYMDTPVLFAHLPFQFRILAKGGLWKAPFIGWYLNRSGQVPVHSGSPRSLVAGLLRGAATLESGLSLVVFPEGSRTPTGELQSFASGGAFMAIRAGVPVVPVALVGTYELLPIHTYCLRPRPLKIVIGDAIPTESLTTRDADALTDQLYAEITRLFQMRSENAAG